MKNHGIRVLVGDDDADMRKVRIVAPRDEILARLDELEKRTERQGRLLESVCKIVVATGLWRAYRNRSGQR